MSLLLTQANALRIPLPDASVHCVVTSPPYWGLRDYGILGQLGLEPTPELYVEHLVEVFHAVKRTLRNNGTLWLNLGDSYSQGGGKQVLQTKNASHGLEGMRAKTPNMASKQLLGIPWRVALALQADGWWLRSDIIWHKPNCMPESVRDRPTKAHEYLFLLTKSKRYFYDADAIREPIANSTASDHRLGWYKAGRPERGYPNERPSRGAGLLQPNPAGRNRRTVWTIPTQPYSGAHFATFPPALVEPCIKAGTSERGVCPVCGAPWERVVEDSKAYAALKAQRRKTQYRDYDKPDEVCQFSSSTGGITAEHYTIGWRPTCNHDSEPIPATVLDPFCGSGTTLLVARKLDRHAIGLDLSGAYLQDQARERLGLTALEAWETGRPAQEAELAGLPLFGAT